MAEAIMNRKGMPTFRAYSAGSQRETSELFGYLVMVFAKDKRLKADMKRLREAIKDGSCTVSEWKPLSGLASSRPQIGGA